MIKLLLTLLITVQLLLAAGQSAVQLDSMLRLLPTQKADSHRVKTLSKISQYYYTVSPLKSFPYANEALQLAEKIQWKRGIANLHNNLGLYISDTGNNQLAREHFEKSYQLNLELGARVNQVNNLNNIGRGYMVESAFTQAADNFFKALAIAEELKDQDLIALVAGNISNCFSVQKDYAKAIQYAQLELSAGTKANSSRRITHALTALGIFTFAQHDTMAARAYAQRALKIAEDSHNKVDEANVLINLSNFMAPDYPRQVSLMLRVNSIMDEINPLSETSLVNNANLGELYTRLALQSGAAQKAVYQRKAEESLLKAKSLAEKTNSPAYLAAIYTDLERLEEQKGNYQSALVYLKKATATNDSLFSQDKKNAIAGLEGKHNLAVKDNEIAINKLLLASQRKTQWGLIAGVAFLLVIGALLYRQSRSRKKTNTTLMVLNNQLDEANKIKARFFSILSHDLRSPIVNLVHFLHLQRESPDLLGPEQQRLQQQNISDAAENLLINMESMLLWSKEQMENFKPNIKMVPVEALFNYLQQFFAHVQQVSLRFEARPGMVVATDENYLRTIMQNLTSNAIRAVKNAATPQVVWRAVQEGNSIQLSITDNGPGIAEEQAKTLFEDSVVANSKHGLGLHLVRDLAKAIQYSIAVSSSPGAGTTFVLSSTRA
ncbi:MAG TPA: HAMP domain-containing sensor histidine kinase [Chitinophagaceae bacterium]|nr:HAMP domain-containing sensor histidine kinase [Chitinophagaceae bacterium]